MNYIVTLELRTGRRVRLLVTDVKSRVSANRLAMAYVGDDDLSHLEYTEPVTSIVTEL